MIHFPKKENSPDFSDAAAQQTYVQSTQSHKELIQKELDVNQNEQVLLKKRIAMMKEFINDLPSSDPQYRMLRRQTEMDQIEIDELKIRETILTEILSK